MPTSTDEIVSVQRFNKCTYVTVCEAGLYYEMRHDSDNFFDVAWVGQALTPTMRRDSLLSPSQRLHLINKFNLDALVTFLS